MRRMHVLRRTGHVIELGSVAAGGAIAGALIEHLLDPDRGHSRRARLRDEVRSKARSRVHRGQMMARRTSHRAVDRLRGEVYGRLQHLGAPSEEFDNVTLAQKVRSEALGHMSRGHLGHVTVDAVNGTVTLRGEVRSSLESTQVEYAVRRVRGVREVENLLHRKGDPPPNKAAVLAIHDAVS